MPNSSPLIAWKPAAMNRNIASARLRCFAPCEYMKQEGWHCEIFDYRNADRYGLVIFQKTYEEDDIALARSLKSKRVKIAFDLCDNHFYNPTNDPVLSERASRLRRMIDLVDFVSVSTPELQKLVQDKESFVVDDAIEVPQSNPMMTAYSRVKRRLRRPSSMLSIVWYGNAGLEEPPFGVVDMAKVVPLLEELNSEVPLELTVISNSRAAFQRHIKPASFNVRYEEWRRASFARRFQQHEICILPISLNPFTICKTNNRLVLSLLLGVPVVADMIPSYEEFGDYVLFSDWRANLRAYALDRKLRQQHVEEGQQYIYSKYSRERVVAQWSHVFNSLLN